MLLLAFQGILFILTLVEGKQSEIPMKELGTIGRTTYFTPENESISLSWASARGLCEYQGYEMGWYEYDEQFEFVQRILPVTAKLWINVHMKGMGDYPNYRAPFQNGDGSAFTTKNLQIDFDRYSCLYHDGDDHIRMDLCNTTRGVLCQRRELQKCGIVGHAVEKDVTLDIPLNSTASIGTVLVRWQIYNVSATGANPHPHNKYLTGYRLPSEYYYVASTDYPNFLADEGTNVIGRLVNFYCNDPESTVYQYSFKLEVQ